MWQSYASWFLLLRHCIPWIQVWLAVKINQICLWWIERRGFQGLWGLSKVGCYIRKILVFRSWVICIWVWWWWWLFASWWVQVDSSIDLVLLWIEFNWAICVAVRVYHGCCLIDFFDRLCWGRRVGRCLCIVILMGAVVLRMTVGHNFIGPSLFNN